jgi:hypothetical protein
VPGIVLARIPEDGVITVDRQDPLSREEACFMRAERERSNSELLERWRHLGLDRPWVPMASNVNINMLMLSSPCYDQLLPFNGVPMGQGAW